MENNNCPEFPHFGARYPDAQCQNGYLWDLEKYEDGLLFGGGEDPCPFCNTEAYLKWAGVNPDAEEAPKREDVLSYIEKLKERYGKKNNPSAPKP